jgi:predicted lipid-binding transport protein (Tim44 family)
MTFLLLDILLTTAVVIFSMRLFQQAHPPPAAIEEKPGAPLERVGGPVAVSIQPIAPAGRPAPLEETLRHICRAVGYASTAEFVEGAKQTYELVLDAFAAGDLRDCDHLLAPEVRETFATAIAERRAKGETLSNMFIGFRSCDPVDAGVTSGIAWVEVRFVAQMVSVVRDRAGKVIAGRSDRVVDVAQRWTFEKELKAVGREWLLLVTDTED